MATGMTLDRYNEFCASLPHATHVVQWGGSHVWKVGGKVFAIASVEVDGKVFVTFKCSPLSFDLLKGEAGMRPAPYLASRGLVWLQRTSAVAIDDATLMAYVRESHRLAGLNLPKRVQRELGFLPATGGRA